MRLFTEVEVSEILRCSREKVARLRASGLLAYLPGRPPCCSDRGIAAFLNSAKVYGGREYSQASLPDLLTPDDAAKQFGIDVGRFLRLQRLQRTPHVRLSKNAASARFDRLDLKDFKVLDEDDIKGEYSSFSGMTPHERAQIKWMQRQNRMKERTIKR